MDTGVFEESEEGVVCNCRGQTARQYKGNFQDDYPTDASVEVPGKLDELIHCFPDYSGWQQEYWRGHYSAGCSYLGHVDVRKLLALGVIDDAMWAGEQRERIQESAKGGHLQCYPFW